MGDFYVDLMRILVFVFVPLCVILALLLVANGMPMTFLGAAKATPLDGAAAKMDTQTICRGPVAALVAIKQIGTNGGGFFGPNSTHPYENPSPWSNLIELVAIVVLPMASLVMVGLMLKNRAHAAVIYGVMLASWWSESSWPSTTRCSPALPPRILRWSRGRTWRARRSAWERFPGRPGPP